MTLSALSLARLSECHPLLQTLVQMVETKTSVAVVCGFRNEITQNAAFASDRSRLQWPHSRHNKQPSEAVDLVPLPLDWDETQPFYALAATVKETAAQLGIQIEWGGDWETFKDLDHFQLKAGTF